jgi:hypothetical protein
MIDDVDLKVTYFNNCVITLLNTFLPVYSVSRHTSDKPWITDEFRRLIRCRQHAWTSGNRTQYKRLRNQVNRLSRQLRQQFYNKRLQNLRTCDPRLWWREIKRLTGQSARSESEMSSLVNDAAGGDARLLADLVNESLQQVSCDLRPLSPTYIVDTTDADTQYSIKPYEVFDKLTRINIYKSPGPDGIPNWFLRDFAFAISEPICHIFNSSISQGTMPTLWKKSYVVPIPKTRPPKSIQNDLRPISLTPTISKVLESLVGRWILSKIADKFDARQFGALKRRSTVHALIDITHTWHQALDHKNSVRALFVDYAKAFDHVDHTTVLAKMATLGVDPVLLKWMHSYLLRRQQCVKIGRAFSSWTSPNGGMPQGTWLGFYRARQRRAR